MTPPSHNEEVLVPRLYSVFNIESCSDISLDPLVPAVYCFLTGGPVRAGTALQHGADWYPSRAVTSVKGEATRFKRFAEKHPGVFTYVKESDSLELKVAALSGPNPHECDEWLYRMILHRLHPADPTLVDRAIGDLDVGEASH
jgi:hypothetical protein